MKTRSRQLCCVPGGRPRAGPARACEAWEFEPKLLRLDLCSGLEHWKVANDNIRNSFIARIHLKRRRYSQTDCSVLRGWLVCRLAPRNLRIGFERGVLLRTVTRSASSANTSRYQVMLPGMKHLIMMLLSPNLMGQTIVLPNKFGSVISASSGTSIHPPSNRTR